MRLPNDAHTSRSWRIHDLTRDFRLEDVWGLPVSGDRLDFPRLVQLVTSFDPVHSSSFAIRGLFTIRKRLGGLIGLDADAAGVGSRVASVRDRLPPDLRQGPPGPRPGSLPFTSLYLTDDEWAAESANRTVHGLLHLGWVPDGAGGYRAQMAVYVKRNGLIGATYMAAITPFRYLAVYPAMMRELERRWQEEARSASGQGATA